MAVLVVFPGVTLALLNWSDDPSLRWIDELRARKFRAAELAGEGGRILIAGGSSAAFSVDAELLEAKLGRPAVEYRFARGARLEVPARRCAPRGAYRGSTCCSISNTRNIIAPMGNSAISNASICGPANRSGSRTCRRSSPRSKSTATRGAITSPHTNDGDAGGRWIRSGPPQGVDALQLCEHRSARGFSRGCAGHAGDRGAETGGAGRNRRGCRTATRGFFCMVPAPRGARGGGASGGAARAVGAGGGDRSGSRFLCGSPASGAGRSRFLAMAAGVFVRYALFMPMRRGGGCERRRSCPNSRVCWGTSRPLVTP